MTTKEKILEEIKDINYAYNDCSKYNTIKILLDEMEEGSGMDDLISRQAAIEAIVNTVSEIGLHDNSEVARYGATFRQHEIIDIIEGMPSAQPEIIRCKDCKFYSPNNGGECTRCGGLQYLITEDEYCSKGEQK